jgi:DNA-binding winged helix-turn-helix (wHTH) protein
LSRIVRKEERYLRFGAFYLDLQREELFRDGTRLRLHGKALQLLFILLEKAGEVVTREELRQRLWPSDTHVDYDANVNTTINRLRQTLHDSSGRSQYIETIPRRGYCFVAPMEYVSTPPATASRRASAGSTAGPASPQRTRYPAIWTAVAAIVILTGGMLFGAGIVTLWFAHAFTLPWH